MATASILVGGVESSYEYGNALRHRNRPSVRKPLTANGKKELPLRIKDQILAIWDRLHDAGCEEELSAAVERELARKGVHVSQHQIDLAVQEDRQAAKRALRFVRESNRYAVEESFRLERECRVEVSVR